MAGEVFLDSGYAIALAADSDQLHPRAVEIAADMENQSRRMVTHQAVLLEIGNSLSMMRYRAAAVEMLSALASDPNIEVVPLTNELYLQAFELFCTRPDKEWSLTDCVSFVAMQSRGLTEALTADKHFEQAGFRALLLPA